MSGRIINLNAGVYQILDGSNIIEARARGKFRRMKIDKDSHFNKGNLNPLSNKMDTTIVKISPKVGDIVDYEINDGINYITNIYPRKNELIRPDIANVDQIILVISAKEPDFSTYLLDLFLVNLNTFNILPIIVISKIDKCNELELKNIKDTMSYYEERLKYKVFYVNSKDHTKDLSEIKNLLEGKITVLSGQTGAGKSTFINSLIPGFNLETQEISNALNRGKHTTRQIHLYEYYKGLVGDTPGFSKLDFFVKQENLKDMFIEFDSSNCRFKDCMHLKNSKDCHVREEAGKSILKSRYDNYLKMYEKMNQRY
jgi:ribosome biogenesis GTPase